METNISDDILLARLTHGDDKAFEVIVKRYSSVLYASAYNLFRERQTCEDMVQELFIDLWEKKHLLGIKTLKSYLFVAIKNKVLTAIRSGKVFVDIEVLHNICAKYETDQALIAKELTGLLDRSIGKLPTKCQIVFKLSRFENLSNREIADRLNISVKTVENQMTIALSRLKNSSFEYLTLLIFLSSELF